jgi:outer membrane protein assembly factor BamD
LKKQVLTRTSEKARQSCGRWPLVLTIALFQACASAPPIEEEIPSAEGYYQSALEKLEGESLLFFFSDVDYPGAIELLQEVIDNYPYSEYALLAELKIADVHFERENYEEAASFYQDFVELHPSHEQVPYAIYRNGLSSFERMRASDQDQTPTQEALAQFTVLIERYPDSELAKDAGERIREVEDRLAGADVAIGDFYFERGEYHASIRRYRSALTQYPGHTDRVRTLARLGMALHRMQRLYEAEQLYHQVLALGEAEDEILDQVRQELAELEDTAGAGTALQRSCVTDPNAACENGAP